MGKYQKKLLFKSFEKAREFARTLGLTSQKEWEKRGPKNQDRKSTSARSACGTLTSSDVRIP